MSHHREPWERGCEVVLAAVAEERRRQVARFGHNDDLEYGTGWGVRWLAPLSALEADEIERALRADYEETERATGAPTWMHLIREEVAEAFLESDPDRLAAELVQVAALCVSWIEKINRRKAMSRHPSARGEVGWEQ